MFFGCLCLLWAPPAILCGCLYTLEPSSYADGMRVFTGAIQPCSLDACIHWIHPAMRSAGLYTLGPSSYVHWMPVDALGPSSHAHWMPVYTGSIQPCSLDACMHWVPPATLSGCLYALGRPPSVHIGLLLRGEHHVLHRGGPFLRSNTNPS